VALINWEDEPRQLTVPLGTLGIGGAKFDAYDVWRDAPLVVPKDVLAATLEPHSTLTVALRAAAAHPQVVGTTRHIVQGAVDIADETWDVTARTLKARSVNLDSRAYVVTVSVPRGFRPGTCKADVPCTVKRPQRGHAVREGAAGGDGPADRVAMSGQRKLFHWSAKAITASVASAGFESGSTTRQNTVHSPAPSSRAASSKSRGMVRKHCRSRKIPHTETSSVEISPVYESTQPRALMIKKRGTRSTTTGTMRTDR